MLRVRRGGCRPGANYKKLLQNPHLRTKRSIRYRPGDAYNVCLSVNQAWSVGGW